MAYTIRETSIALPVTKRRVLLRGLQFRAFRCKFFKVLRETAENSDGDPIIAVGVDRAAPFQHSTNLPEYSRVTQVTAGMLYYIVHSELQAYNQHTEAIVAPLTILCPPRVNYVQLRDGTNLKWKMKGTYAYELTDGKNYTLKPHQLWLLNRRWQPAYTIAKAFSEYLYRKTELQSDLDLQNDLSKLLPLVDKYHNPMFLLIQLEKASIEMCISLRQESTADL